jgi:hypothetical protein
MVVETYRNGPAPVYARFRERGRMTPEGLNYVSSWVTELGERCYQIMECEDRTLLDVWISRWSDIVSFEVEPIITSAEAASRFSTDA